MGLDGLENLFVTIQILKRMMRITGVFALTCFSPVSGSKASVRYYVKDGQLSNVRHTWIYFTFMVDEEAAPSIEKAGRTHGATYSEHEVLLVTRGNDEDDDEPRIGKYTSGKISRKRKDFYSPQRSWGKVIFSQASVILFTRGVCLSACWDTAPPDQAGTPPSGAEHTGRYGQRAGGTRPTGMQSCSWIFFGVFQN